MPPSILPNRISTRWANMHELLASTLLPGLDHGASYFLQRFGLEKLDTLYQKGQYRESLPFDSVMMGKFAERVIAANDRELLRNPNTALCNQIYKQGGHSVVWVETLGRVDVGKKKIFRSNQLPCDLSGQLTIRKLEPYDCPSGSLPGGVSWHSITQLPVSAAMARTLAPGSILEISGETVGRFRIEKQANLAISPRKFFTIRVDRLPDPDSVSVRFAQGNSLEGNLGYQKRYGPFANLKSILANVLSALNPFRWLQSSTKATAEAKRVSTEETIKQYRFNLANPEQAKAYDRLLKSLSTQEADRLACDLNGQQKELSYEINTGIQVGDTQLTLYRRIETEKNADFSNVKYRELKSINETISKWLRKTLIVWEWIQMKGTESDAKSTSYCHLTYHSPYASDFFTVADSLNLQIHPEARTILVDYPKTEFNADIYFTNRGIENIQNASLRSAVEAYLGMPISELHLRYAEIEQLWFFRRFYYRSEQKRILEKEPLIDQKKKLTKAFQFAEKLTRSQGKLNQFFDSDSIVGLMRLATREQTIIHELSLLGPGIGISNQDEGRLEHPGQPNLSTGGL